MTKLVASLFTISLMLFANDTLTPRIIAVDVKFCDNINSFEKSICAIEEAEYKSNDQLTLDQKGKIHNIIIDKRSITSEKAKALFGNGTITIEQKNVISTPFLNDVILIQPGIYVVEEMKRGYKIQLRDYINKKV